MAAFVLGAAVVLVGGLLVPYGAGRLGHRQHETAVGVDAGRRNVAQLTALSDADLESVDLVEMNIAVAREIPGLEHLDYDHYRRVVDDWTEQFARWLPQAEAQGFYPNPQKYKNDIQFFRLGMLAQFLDQTVGIAYVEDQKQMQLAARAASRRPEIAYSDAGHLLLHGLIDTKQGTCGTMPTLHVAIGRRLGWPVGLACTGSHFVCRCDDGKVVYNIEATDTGRGGFAAGSDEEYIDQEGISAQAIAVGSDLRKLTAREMLGVFIAARARYYNDTGRSDLAARDYCLAFTQFPNNREGYISLVGTLIETGEKLFTANERGHPASLAAYLSGKYTPRRVGASRQGIPRYGLDPAADVDAVMALNRASMQMMVPSPPSSGEQHGSGSYGQ